MRKDIRKSLAYRFTSEGAGDVCPPALPHTAGHGTGSLSSGPGNPYFPVLLSRTEIMRSHPKAMLVRKMCKLLAKEHGIGITSQEMFKWLREEGYLTDNPECYNAPSRESEAKGWIVAAASIRTGDGIKYATPYITLEGYHHLSLKIIEKGGRI